MSKTGQLTRGLKYYLQRKNDGTMPKGVMEDPNKLADLEAYKSFAEGKDEKELQRKLIILRHLGRSSQRRSVMVNDLKNAILNDEKADPKAEEAVLKDEKALENSML